jgi:hypothetical protein
MDDGEGLKHRPFDIHQIRSEKRLWYEPCVTQLKY